MDAPLPPGRLGLPLLGETLAMIRDPYAFLAERKARHGPVFRSKILGRKVAFVSGPRAMAAFLDEENVTREGGHPAHVRALFGGININMYDGLRHRARSCDWTIPTQNLGYHYNLIPAELRSGLQATVTRRA